VHFRPDYIARGLENPRPTVRETLSDLLISGGARGIQCGMALCAFPIILIDSQERTFEYAQFEVIGLFHDRDLSVAARLRALQVKRALKVNLLLHHYTLSAKGELCFESMRRLIPEIYRFKHLGNFSDGPAGHAAGPIFHVEDCHLLPISFLHGKANDLVGILE
jgi:hypothetical protein